MESFDLLVIILSVMLAIFLALSIWVLVYAVKIMKSLRHITEKAEHIADNVDAVGSFFKKTAGPVALGKFVANIVELFKNRQKRGKDEQ